VFAWHNNTGGSVQIAGRTRYGRALRVHPPDDFVSSYLTDYFRADGDPRTRRIRVRHLLTMSSGISWSQSASENMSDQMGHSGDWVRFILDRPMAAEPGSVTKYSNGDAHLLSVVLQRATGKTALDFARTTFLSSAGHRGCGVGCREIVRAAA
jgi:CubicO group peptidase (beta-lactamase class C family)